MKLLALLAIVSVAAHASPVEYDQVSGENGWYVPQADGTLLWMDKQEAESIMAEMNQHEGRGIFSNNVNFYLWTKANPVNAQQIAPTKDSIDASNFNPANPTKFLIHGWTNDYLDESNIIVRDAWFTQGDFNIISVDWERARSKDYISSVIAIPEAGKKVADMLNFIVSTYGISLDKFTVIGHSLGAHVAGHTGKNVKNGQVHTIVGLDPALPLFSYDKPKERLAYTDARYVETIQTNGGKLGFLRPIGVTAFYPNGGKYQPGCGLDLEGFCSHRRSFTYYAEAVERNTFPTYQCNSHEEAVKQNCGSVFSAVRMAAADNAFKVTGVYYAPVRTSEPWGFDA